MWVEKTPKFTSKYTGRQSPLLDSFQKEDFGLVFDVGREKPQLPHPALRSLGQHVQNGQDHTIESEVNQGYSEVDVQEVQEVHEEQQQVVSQMNGTHEVSETDRVSE